MILGIPPHGRVKVADRFEDLTLDQYRLIVQSDGDLYKFMEAVTGKDCTLADVAQLKTIAETLSSLYYPKEVAPDTELKELERWTFADVTAFEMACEREYDDPAQQYYDLLKPFFDDPWSLTMGKALSVVNRYVDELSKLNKAWSTNMKGGYTNDEIKAGVKNFEYFGRWGVVRRLASSVDRMEAIWNLPYREVYTATLYDYTEGQYIKKYNEIINK